MSNNRRAIGSQRRFGRSRACGTPARPPRRSPLTIERILGVPAVDRALGRLLAHPRALLLGGLLIGLAMVALALYPLLFPSAQPAAPIVQPVAALATPAPPATPDAPADQEVLAVVAAYNQASITAAVLHQPDPMAPFLAPDGKTWAEVQAEYQRRAAKGETHDPALTRWGILRIAVEGETATVETQEQWDDVTSVGGQIVSSRRGILTRNVYELRRAPSAGKWWITNVTTTVVIS